MNNVRGASRGSAHGASGHRFEHFRLLLEDPTQTSFDDFADIAEKLARADVPSSIAAAFRIGTLTALAKPQGGVRGICAGDCLRRMVARTTVQQHSEAIESKTAPFEFALSTRAGADAAALFIRTRLAEDQDLVVMALDGIGAYDHVDREAMMTGLRETCPSMVPFCRMFYGEPSTLFWEDEDGLSHEVRQTQGGEQEDPWMPSLFSMAMHPGLERAAPALEDGEAWEDCNGTDDAQDETEPQCCLPVTATNGLCNVNR